MYDKGMKYSDYKRRNEMVVNGFNCRVRPEWRTKIRLTNELEPYRTLFYYKDSLSLLDALRSHIKKLLNLTGFHVDVDYRFLIIRVYNSEGREIGVFDPKNFSPSEIKKCVGRLNKKER